MAGDAESPQPTWPIRANISWSDIEAMLAECSAEISD
jgi:hypothetical protein